MAETETAKPTPGPWTARGMGGESIVTAPTHRWHNEMPNGLGFPIAIPRTYVDPVDGETHVDFSSAGFSHDDASLVAAAPALAEALEKLMERYLALANSGDCGFWNPEEETEIILSRAALTKAGLAP